MRAGKVTLMMMLLANVLLPVHADDIGAGKETEFPVTEPNDSPESEGHFEMLLEFFCGGDASDE